MQSLILFGVRYTILLLETPIPLNAVCAFVQLPAVRVSPTAGTRTRTFLSATFRQNLIIVFLLRRSAKYVAG